MTDTRAGSNKDAEASQSVGGAGKPGHPAPARGSVSSFQIWFGLFGGAAAWTVQLIVNYAIAAHGCYPRYVPLAVPVTGQASFSISLVAISILATVIGIAALLVAITAWRHTSGETGGEAHWLLDTGEGRTRFMAAAGIMTSAVFLLSILFHFAAVIFLGHC